MDKPILSIILPIFNGEKYICKKINSLLDININKEIIVINDGSEDDSLNILLKYKEKIKLINLEKNKGVSNARNIGIDAATGKYISFVDVDDKIEPENYVKVIKKMEVEKASVGVCRYDMLNTDNKIKSSNYDYNFKNNEDFFKFFLINKISPSSCDKIFSKNILKNIRFNSTLKIGEDILFCFNVFYNADKVIFFDDVLCHYLQHTESAMHTLSEDLLIYNLIMANLPKKIFTEKKYNLEFEYFRLRLKTRELHTISKLINKSNYKYGIKLLESSFNKEDANLILKNKYFSIIDKAEALFIRILGIKLYIYLIYILLNIISKTHT